MNDNQSNKNYRLMISLSKIFGDVVQGVSMRAEPPAGDAYIVMLSRALTRDEQSRFPKNHADGLPIRTEIIGTIDARRDNRPVPSFDEINKKPSNAKPSNCGGHGPSCKGNGPCQGPK